MQRGDRPPLQTKLDGQQRTGGDVDRGEQRPVNAGHTLEPAADEQRRAAPRHTLDVAERDRLHSPWELPAERVEVYRAGGNAVRPENGRPGTTRPPRR